MTLCLLLLLSVIARAAEPSPSSGARVNFENDIRPIFERSCYRCHGTEKQKSNFRLDEKSSALKGGEHGKAILPGHGTESPLIQYISGAVKEMQMPPEGDPLTGREISLLRTWIDQGAEWPDDPSRRPKDKSDFWTFKPVTLSSPPPVSKNRWVRNEIDSFIAERLAREKLSPTAEASPLTLIRRLSFDLTGLPPSAAEVRWFLEDTRPGAYERLVDRLLASSAYGERAARHWLDLVHFGETHGYDKDKPRPNAWPYRDYVIRSFNMDKPYGRFVSEQIAGDALFPDDPEGVVATGLLAAGPWDFVGHVELPESKTDGLIARYNDRDDMVMTVMSTFQSLTVHCARCHDHKFDPISQRDYYQLQAVFAGTDRADRPYDADPELFRRRQGLLQAKRKAKNDPEELKRLEAELKKLPRAFYVYGGASDFPRNGSFMPADPIRTVHLLQRGDVKSPKEAMEPGPMGCFADLKVGFVCNDSANEGERRAALARWLTQPGNWLTRRSLVNRVWQQHFGRGLVETPNDFGHMGALPTHPELLDWLAQWFREHGESIKGLHRLIVTSATYRQGSSSRLDYEKLDGDNRYYWRMTRQRLDAESFHDALLFVSGELDRRMGGPSIQQFYFKDDHSPIYDYTRYQAEDPGARRRSIYRFIVRSVPDPFMESLDFPDCSLLTPKRNVAVTALQALNGLNDPFVLRQAGIWARRLAAQSASPAEQVRLAWEAALHHPPSASEWPALTAYNEAHGPANLCRLIFNLNEFLFLD